MADQVKMQHPSIGGEPTPVSLKAYEGVWKAKGWKLVDDDGRSTKFAAPETADDGTGDDSPELEQSPRRFGGKSKE